MRQAAIVGWTGKGRLSDLEESLRGSLAATGQLRGARLRRAGRSFVCVGVDPIVVSRTVNNLPGVSWIALGYEVQNGLEGFTKVAITLARRYLSRGSRTFAVSVAGDDDSQAEGDIILAVSSAILSAIKGTRVEEGQKKKPPGVKFRLSYSGSVGACGVQLREGAGGVPTSKKRIAYCLVSGGRHSSAATWIAALAGFSLNLVHVSAGDESLRQVSKLYSELSYRMDPSRLGLEVVEGRGSVAQILDSWLGDSSRKPPAVVVVGAHLECDGEALSYASGARRGVLFPVLLLQEEEVNEVHQGLGMKKESRATTTPSGILRIIVRGGGLLPVVRYRVRRFKNGRADMHRVLDSIDRLW